MTLTILFPFILASNRQWDDKDIESQAEMDRFVEDGALDNVESFLSHDDTDPRDAVGRSMDVGKGETSHPTFMIPLLICLYSFYIHPYHFLYAGFTFNELSSFRASQGKVTCCHFSSDGKVLATGGHDKKVSYNISVMLCFVFVLSLFYLSPF